MKANTTIVTHPATKAEIKAASARYLKIVEWSDEDNCFVGRCPGLFFGGCDGMNEAQVYVELCEIVAEHVAEMLAGRKPLPASTAGKQYSGKFIVRLSPELHQKAALKALSRGESLNQFVAEALAHA
jgi:predicted HicB family RNase H-like nuclease